MTKKDPIIEEYVQMMAMIEEVYFEYLNDQGTDDTPILRFGYYLIAKESVEADTLMHPEARERSISKLNTMIALVRKQMSNKIRDGLKSPS